MAVVETVSTNGGYKVFSSSNATLATAIGEVINELEAHKIPKSQIDFELVCDGAATPIYTVMALCKGS